MSLPLLLVPGLLCDAALWRHQARALSANRPVRVVDHAIASSIETGARMILASAPPRFALAGLSMGGYIALAMALLAPERIDRLALLDTNAHDDPPASREKRLAQVARADAGAFEAVVDDQLGVLVAPASRARPEVAETVRAMAARAGVGVFARQQQAIRTRADQRPRLATIAMPTLILCGALDQVTPPAVHEEMHHAMPGSRLEVVPDAGHLTPLEQPEAVTRALTGWLQS